MQSRWIPLFLMVTACPQDKSESDTALDPDCDLPAVSPAPAWPNFQVNPSNFVWQDSPVLPAIDINSNSFHGYAGLSVSDVLSDFNSAANVWSTTGAKVAMAVGDEHSSTEAIYVDPDDRAFEVVMINDNADTGYALATHTTSYRLPSCSIGCDIVVYALDTRGGVKNWVSNTTPANGEYDLLVTFVHELGHCVGMGDNYTFSNTIMNEQQAGEDFTSLSTVDVEVTKHLYGAQ